MKSKRKIVDPIKRVAARNALAALRRGDWISANFMPVSIKDRSVKELRRMLQYAILNAEIAGRQLELIHGLLSHAELVEAGVIYP